MASGWIDQDATWYGCELGPGDVVLEGIATPPIRGTARLFSAHVYCGQTAGWMNTPLDTEVDLGSDHIVLDGDPAPPVRKGHSTPPLFSAHDYCGQRAGWMKTPHGTSADLGPGHIVLDGDPAPPPRKRGTSASPSFQPMSMAWRWARPRRLCHRWRPSSPSDKGAQPPIFGHCPLWLKGWMD